MTFKIITNKFDCSFECNNKEFIFIDRDTHTNYNHYDPILKCTLCGRYKTTWKDYCYKTDKKVTLNNNELINVNKYIEKTNKRQQYERYSQIKVESESK